jgi:hypothetical protein
MNTTPKWLASAAVLAALGGIWYYNNRPEAIDTPVQEAKPVARPAPKLNPPPSYQSTSANQSWQNNESSVSTPKVPVPEYGTTPATPSDLLKTPQGRSNLEALRDPQKFPSRLNPMIPGEKFDPAAWANNPEYREKYLSISEPSRALRSSENPNDPPLQRVTPAEMEVSHGERITITVKTLPNSPCSFFSPSLNRFTQNGLTHCTVVSDAAGYASAEMEGVPGTIGPTDVLCAAPLSSSLVTIRVTTNKARPQL